MVSQASWTEKPAARRIERAAWGRERDQEDRRTVSHLDVLHGLNLPVVDQTSVIIFVSPTLAAGLNVATLLTPSSSPHPS